MLNPEVHDNTKAHASSCVSLLSHTIVHTGESSDHKVAVRHKQRGTHRVCIIMLADVYNRYSLWPMIVNIVEVITPKENSSVTG